jgi:hypothetical protein
MKNTFSSDTWWMGDCLEVMPWMRIFWENPAIFQRFQGFPEWVFPIQILKNIF